MAISLQFKYTTLNLILQAEKEAEAAVEKAPQKEDATIPDQWNTQAEIPAPIESSDWATEAMPVVPPSTTGGAAPFDMGAAPAPTEDWSASADDWSATPAPPAATTDWGGSNAENWN